MIDYAERGFILLPSPFGEGLGVRLFSLFTLHFSLFTPSPSGESEGGLGEYEDLFLGLTEPFLWIQLVAEGSAFR